MSRVLLRNTVLSALIAVMSATAWAGARDKVDTLLRNYDSISRDLQKAQSAQSALLAQKTALDARGSDLVKRQDALNAHPRDPNQTAPSQQQAPDAGKPRCDDVSHADGKSAPQRAAGCDSKTKKLGKMGLSVNAGALPIETGQTRLDLEYNQYNEAAHDWNAQEQQTIAALNKQYRSLNDWADRAEGLITSAPFQAEVVAEHWERYCPDRAMPSGVLSIDQVVSFADGYADCLKYVGSRPKTAAYKAP